jgi:hypothetical protein
VEVVAAVERLPGRAAEGGDPVVRLLRPDVPVGMLAEPAVLDRGVAGHHVHEELEPAGVRLLGQPVELGEVAEDRVDVRVVGHVVAEVGHRRGIDRRQPERVDAEPGQVVEPRADAGEVADAVPVRILERARVDLVDDAVHASAAG